MSKNSIKEFYSNLLPLDGFVAESRWIHIFASHTTVRHQIFEMRPFLGGAIKSGWLLRTAEPQLGEWSRLLKWAAPINSHPPLIFQGRRPDTYQPEPAGSPGWYVSRRWG